MLTFFGLLFDSILVYRTQDMVKILHSGQQGRTLFPCLENPIFTLFSAESAI